MVYGYARVSTKKQSLERQIKNIMELYPNATIYSDEFTGTTMNRPNWSKLQTVIKCGDTIVFDSVSRMSRDAEQGFAIYEKLYNDGVELVFIKEKHINTEVYKTALGNMVNLTGTTVDLILNGINSYLMALAKEQIKLAFDQAEKEVTDLHKRTAEGMKVSGATNRTDADGNKIPGKIAKGRTGNTYATKKETETKGIILKHSRDFGGSLSDAELIKLAQVSRNSFYKYKADLKNGKVVAI